MPNKSQIDELKIILLARKDSILANINSSRANIDELKGQEINDDLDYAELVSDSFTEGMIANHQLEELKQIEESLLKISKGTYGICDMCGVVIPLGRLKAKPFAKFCTECRTVYEHEFVKRAKN
ncbi:MAG: RNA polymerase-binding protein DksA [Aliarcobacter sp.]|nr:RNA polymerase-binding protein DksA [Aliarcobacter sp.]